MARQVKAELTLADLDLGPGDESWDQILREVEEYRRVKKLRGDHPYVFDLVRVLRGREKGLGRGFVLHFMHKNRMRLGLPVPRTFDETVQQSYERFCIDSDVFKARGVPASQALFCWPLGKGKGHWAAIHENTDTWLTDFLTKRQQRLKQF